MENDVFKCFSVVRKFNIFCVICVILIDLVTSSLESFPAEQTRRSQSKSPDDESDFSDNQIISWDKMWPGGIIYYEISSHFNDSSIQLIHGAMKEISQNTCIRYQKHTVQPDYIYFQDTFGDGCHTYAGRKGGKQILNLDPQRCIQHGKIMHELLHVLGFHHEHQRPDRDAYISIFWDNIKPEDRSQLQKLSAPRSYLQGFAYDYGSILHYGNVSFYLAVDREKPILVSKRYAPTMGQRMGLSDLDVKKVNALYQCDFRNARQRQKHRF